MLVFEDIFQVFTCITKQIAIAGIWKFKLKVYGDLSCLLVIFLSYKFGSCLFDVIPEFSAYCFTIRHLLLVCQLPSLVESGQLALRYRWQLPPCFYLMMMHTLGTNAPRPPSSCIRTCTSDICVTHLLKVLAMGQHNTVYH